MKTSRNTDDQTALEKLYDLRDKLLEDNNVIVMKGFQIKEELVTLEDKEKTPEINSKIQNCNTQLSALTKQLEEAKLVEKIAKVREEIKALEIKVLGHPLSDSPHARKNRPSM